MKISLLEPYYSGSHKSWADGLKEHSTHQIKIYPLSGEYWKWRMRTGALYLSSQQYLESIDSPKPKLSNTELFSAECFICSSMMDVAHFIALNREKLHQKPIVTYFHENQLSYPWSSLDKYRDRDHFHFGLTNIKSALSSDLVLFNSQYHKQSFLKNAELLLNSAPDCKDRDTINSLHNKSAVLSVGVDFNGFKNAPLKKDKKIKTILWNHRWEEDKNPQLFFNTLRILKEKGHQFQLILLGEELDVEIDVFTQAKKDFKEEIIHFGYASSRSEYIRLMSQADILPVTSDHDFFGVSVVEAIFSGCYPLLPDKLSYPEHIPSNLHDVYLYRSREELLSKLISLIEGSILPPSSPDLPSPLQSHVSRYSWDKIAPLYDEKLTSLLKEH